MHNNKLSYVLAFDTANEAIAIGLGRLHGEGRSVEVVASLEAAAHRASNTQLLPRIDAALAERGIPKGQLACVVCGRGPGSFTGVRIAMATAKGIASALGVPLVGVSTLDAVAWGAWQQGVRGRVLVAADAMRKEVYPVRFDLADDGVARLGADRVVKAEAAAEELAGREQAGHHGVLLLTGDALCKYGELFAPLGELLPEELWTPTGRGLLLALQAAWRAGEVDPFDAQRHDPAFALPVYTRLSDAEENERIRLAKNDPKNLRTGVQDAGDAGMAGGANRPALRRDQRATMHDTAILNARADKNGVTYKPLDAAHVAELVALDARLMPCDAWSEALVADELPRADRVWWAAYLPETQGGSPVSLASAKPAKRSPLVASAMPAEFAASTEPIMPAGPSTFPAQQDKLALVGYAGGWVVDGELQILKVAVAPEARRCGIARELVARVAADARDLGAQACSLEVRARNEGARAFYEFLGLHAIGTRPHYYPDREDALIMKGPLPLAARDVAGMELQVHHATREAACGIVRDTAACATSQTNVSRETSHDQEGQNPAESLSNPAAQGVRSDASAAAFAPVRPLILAIESSCDETAAAIVDGTGALVADVVASQIDFHARFGGVVPEIASRKHIEAICGVCDECFDVAAASLGVPHLAWGDLDAVAVTYAPGLVGALVVGVAFAKGAAWAQDVPFIGVNHMEGHLYANKIGAPDFAPPAVVSLVSGGNTLLVHMKDWGAYETLGATIDDAVGEAFDKVAKALGLGYPGGPVISRYAAKGNPRAIPFPRAMMHSGDLRFSLSGLKTAVVTYINNERAAGREPNIPDIAASFQQAVVDVQVKKAERALRQTGAPTFCLGGGVAANPVLRAAYEQLCARLGVRLVLPPLSACGDNAGMIALVALDRYRQGKFYPLNADAQAHANLDDLY